MKISGYSTALYSTFFFLEELGILFDCGDGAAAMLLGKSRKVKHIFISHADRDHLGGLLQFNQLNAREGFPKVYFPRDCRSFPFLEEFTKQFDPHVKGTEWTKLEDNQEVKIQKDIIVKAVKNNHIPTPNGEMKSHSFKVYRVKQKLKEQYLNLSGLEIKKERERIGIEYMTDEIRENIFTYSADTPIENDGRWNGSNILIHEATFLKREDMGEKGNRWNKHSTLEEVMKRVATSEGIEKLILSHFSSRYNKEEILAAVEKEKALHQIKIPIEIVFPGEFFG
ncbi:MAG: ribonuclease Z [Saprospiraceae bacterium]|jgi:ribonuclease Z